MPVQRSGQLDNWLLVAATTVFVLAAERYFSGAPSVRDRRNAEASSPDANVVQAAAQLRHGRHTSSPWQIPWAGWKDILWRVYKQMGDNRLFALAAGVVFYGLLALFPALAAFVSLYGLFAKTSTLNDQLVLAREGVDLPVAGHA